MLRTLKFFFIFNIIDFCPNPIFNLDFNGVSLSGGDILVNPDLDLAHELKGWWDNEGSTQETTSITVAGARGENSGSGGNVKMIGEVKQENLGYNSDKGDYYSTIATITFFR